MRRLSSFLALCCCLLALTACTCCGRAFSNTPAAGVTMQNTAIDHMGGQVFARGYEHRILLPNDGLFQVNTARFKLSGLRAIQEVARWVSICPHSTVYIDVHSDPIYPRPFEKKLAAQRARAMMAMLVRYGVDPARLIGSIPGRQYPIAANNRLEGYALNRRVEIIW